MPSPRAVPYRILADREIISDIDAAMALMRERGAGARIETESQACLRIENRHAVLPGVSIWCATLDQALTLHFDTSFDHLRIYLPSPTRAVLFAKDRAYQRTVDQAVVCWHAEMERGEFDAGYGGPAMSISRERLLERLAERNGGGAAAPLRFDPEVVTTPGIAEFTRFLLRLLEPGCQDVFSRSVETSESMARAIADMVLDLFPSNHQRLWQANEASVHPYYIKRCLVLIGARKDLRGLDVAALSRHAGVSRRTLEYGFKTFLACTPAAYLKAERLMRARQEILSSDCTVAAVARRHGFGKLARFSHDFERQFGVRPTLIRRRV